MSISSTLKRGQVDAGSALRLGHSCHSHSPAAKVFGPLDLAELMSLMAPWKLFAKFCEIAAQNIQTEIIKTALERRSRTHPVLSDAE